MSNFEKFLLFVNLLLYGLVTVFSYAYVDLNLTLSQNHLVLAFISQMQKLGYFNRPLATSLYLVFIIIAFLFFIFNLWLLNRKKTTKEYLKLAIATNTAVLIFAYPFLSSDLFNYLFDAKIILNYHASPYTHRPLDFPQDEWLRFMRWVHRYSPYGPMWLGMSLIPAVLGFGKFLLNFFAFKVFISIFHLVNSYLIYKILQKLNPGKVLLGTAFYALNPLLLIEGVANAHNDVVLATFIIMPIYLLTLKKTVGSYVALLIGVFVKYISILNLPWLIFFRRSAKRVVMLSLITMTIFTFVFSTFRISVPFVSSGATQVQFQPWYLFWTLPIVALLPNIKLITIALAFSIGASLRYLPFLFYGDWSQPQTLGFIQTVLFIPAFITVFLIVIKSHVRKLK